MRMCELDIIYLHLKLICSLDEFEYGESLTFTKCDKITNTSSLHNCYTFSD